MAWAMAFYWATRVRRFLTGCSQHQLEVITGERFCIHLPRPDWLTELDRYIFLAFKQPNGFDQQAFNFVNATTPILNWDIATFTQEVGLGDPIAGTFMMVANTNNP